MTTWLYNIEVTTPRDEKLIVRLARIPVSGELVGTERGVFRVEEVTLLEPGKVKHPEVLLLHARMTTRRTQ